MKIKKTQAKKGFTLIELLVVIAIIGILSSVVMANLNVARKKARDTKRVSDIEQVRMALELYFEANRTYPDTITDNAIPTELETGDYVSVVPVDPLSSPHPAYKYYSSTTAGGVCSAASKTCMRYHLGAVLEESTNSALSSDVDDAIGFDGTTTDCGATAGVELCFDLTD